MIRLPLIAVTLLVAGSQIAFAQPATDDTPKGTNPPNGRAPFPTRAEQDKIFEDTQGFMNMTPEKQRAYMRDINQKLMRTMMERSGVKDKTVQEEIFLFIDEQEKSREGVRQVAAKISSALELQGVPLDAQRMESLLNDYLAAVEEAKIEREKATKTLDTKIGFSGRPHLRAFLLFNGIIGDAVFLTGDIIMTGTMASGAVGMTPIINKKP